VPLLEQGAVQRSGRGRPRLRPGRVVGDKGYTGRRHRAYLRRRGIRYTIPRRRTEHHSGPFDRAIYRLRARVECLLNRCKQFRSLATRYDQRAASYRALWTIAMILLWIKAAHCRQALGRIRGCDARLARVHAFMGIPYAQAPVGPNQFKPPRVPVRWDGIRDGSRFGPVPHQPTSPGALGSIFTPPNPQGVDCLNLNVWTPDPGAAGLPVFV
jgi:transposase